MLHYKIGSSVLSVSKYYLCSEEKELLRAPVADGIITRWSQLPHSKSTTAVMQRPHFPQAVLSLWLNTVGLLGHGHSWKRKDSLVGDFVSRTSQQTCWTSFKLHCSLRWHSGKECACQCRTCKRHGFDPWVGKIPRSRQWQPTPVFLPGKSHGQRSLAGYSPWGCKRAGHNWASEQQEQCLSAGTQGCRTVAAGPGGPCIAHQVGEHEGESRSLERPSVETALAWNTAGHVSKAWGFWHQRSRLF